MRNLKLIEWTTNNLLHGLDFQREGNNEQLTISEPTGDLYEYQAWHFDIVIICLKLECAAVLSIPRQGVSSFLLWLWMCNVRLT